MTLMEMTLSKMLEAGSVFHLVCMAVIFIFMFYLLYKIGKGIDAKFAVEKDAPQISAAAKTQDGTIAAITAAVKQYKKNK